MITKPRALIFSLVDLSTLNGGAICSLDIFRKLRRLPNLDLVLASSFHANAERANREGATKLGLNNTFLPIPPLIDIERITTPSRFVKTARNLLRLTLDKYYFFNERHYRAIRCCLDAELVHLAHKENPDLIIIDGSWSALCIPSIFKIGTPCCLITHNHEVKIHNDFRRHVQDASNNIARHGMRFWIASHFNGLSNLRFRREIYKLYNQCSGVIALTNNDLPEDLPAHLHRGIFPPLLEESSYRWRHHGRRTILFVGNTNYFANRLAVEWLCTELSPRLLSLDPTVQINIIGAATSDIDARKRCPNVNLLGACDKEVLVEHMTSDGLFIAPTSQTYGAKLKLAESASHGMPFVATETAMAGLPFLSFVPRINLEDPGAAAHLILKYLNDPELLNRLSRDILASMTGARSAQDVALGVFIRKLLAQPRTHNPFRPGDPDFRAGASPS